MTTDTPPRPAIRIALLQLHLGFAAYDEIFAAVVNSLKGAGASVRLVASAYDADPATDDALLVLGAPGYYPTLQQDLAALRARHGHRVRVLLWQMEHVPDPEVSPPVLWALVGKSLLRAAQRGGRMDTMRGASFFLLRRLAKQDLIDDVLCFTRRGAAFLTAHGIPARSLPLGHHPIWGTTQEGAERDIDVLFLGEVLHDRRSRIVRAVRDELAAQGIALKTMYDFNPVGVWGEERNALLRRAKIYLCVYRQPSGSSGLRFSLGMGNGALVVSEPVADPAPFIAGVHFIQAPVGELAKTILALLQDDARRERICRAAARHLQVEYDMAQSAAQLVQWAGDINAMNTPSPPSHVTFAVQDGDATLANRYFYIILKGFVAAGWQADLAVTASPDNAGIDLLWGTVPVQRVGNGRRWAGRLAMFARLLRPRRRHIVLGTVWDWHCYALALARVLFHVPYALFLDTYTFQASATAQKRWKERLRYGFILRHAAVILAETEASRDAAQKHTKRPRVLRAPSGFWERDLLAIEDRCRINGNLPKRLPHILYSGRFIPRKNVHDLITAFQRLAPRFPEWSLQLGGPPTDPAYYARLKAQAAETGLSDRIAFLPPDYGDGLYRRYLQSSVVAMPSEGEGTPTSVLEALYFGGAFVAGNSGYVHYQLGDGAAGLLHTPGDVDELTRHLETLMASPELRESLRARARARTLALFTWEPYFDAIEAAFRQALD